MLRQRFIPLLSFLALLQTAWAQERLHTVVDARTERPLAAATVRLTCLAGPRQDSTVMLITDKAGRFRNPFGQPTEVRIRFIGYRTLTDTLHGTEPHTFPLLESDVDLERIVVTGQYSPQEADRSLYKVRVFDAGDIADRGAATLRDLIGSELNVRLSQDQVLGSSMSIQGLSGQNIKILIDGVPVIGRVNGTIDVGQITLASAERVEIIEGPLSTLYGTDALGGVINVITQQPGSGWSATAEALYESVGVYNIDAAMAGTLAGTRLRVSGGRHLFDGYTPQENGRSMQWKPRETYTADWQAVRSVGSWSLRYSGRYYADYILNRGEPRAPYRETAFDDTYRTYRTSSTLFAGGPAGDHGRIDLTAGYSTYKRRKNTFFKNLVTTETRPTTDPADHDTSYFDAWLLRGVIASSDRDAVLNYQAGFDGSVDINRGRRVEGMERHIGDYALFAGLQYTPVAGLTLQPALRVAYNTEYEAPLIPSLGLRIVPADNTTLRLAYARGFRAPSLRELYFLFVDVNHNIRGNTDLRAETSHSITGSLTWSIPTDAGMLVLEPSAFLNLVDNLITLAQVDGSLYSYINLGKHRTVGGGVSASWYGDALSARAGLSYTGIYNRLSETHDVGEFLFSPEVHADLRYTLPLFDTRLTATYKYTGATPGYALRDDSTPEQSTIGAYHMLDLSLSAPLFDDLLTLGVGGKNLFDVQTVRSGIIQGGEAHTTVGTDLPVAWGRTLFCTLQCTLR